MKANISDKKGDNIPVFMGSYGVGLSRLVGAIIEANHDQKGIIWPKEITPWDYNIINLNTIKTRAGCIGWTRENFAPRYTPTR